MQTYATDTYYTERSIGPFRFRGTAHQASKTLQRPKRREMISELEHVVLVRRGKIEHVLPVGSHWLRPRIDRVMRFSALPTIMNVQGQETPTADGATVRASIAVVLLVTDPIVVAQSGMNQETLYLAAQLALRTAVSNRDLERVLVEREAIAGELLTECVPAAEALGLEITSIAIRDLVLPGDLKRAVAEIISAKLSGQANLERARGEAAAMRSLANTARLAKDNPELLALRLIQQMENSNGNTYVVGSIGAVSSTIASGLPTI
jgi:regulator of protease activity HflC (stomatin/prohibitin superfamily)